MSHLSERIHSKYSNIDFDFEDLRLEIRRLIRNGYVESVAPSPTDFGDYLRSWSYGFRFWSFVVATLFVFPIVEFLQVGFPLIVVRWVAATFLVLFAPGYAFVWVLFPSRMSKLNRLALAIAMSIFMVPAIGLVLNYTSVGIDPGPIAAILVVLTIGLLFGGAYREFRIVTAEHTEVTTVSL